MGLSKSKKLGDPPNEISLFSPFFQALGAAGVAKLALIGGLSPYSTILYYKGIVEEYRRRKGAHPEIVIISISIDRVREFVKRGDFSRLADYIASYVRPIESMGIKNVAIAANTPHLAADKLKERISPTLIHILEAVERKINSLGVTTIGLLATGSTIKYRLYHNYFENKGIKIITPTNSMQRVLDQIIENLTVGLLDTRAKLKISPIIMSLIGRGAEAIVLGCTELPLVLSGVRSRVPIVDSAKEHIEYIVEKIVD